MFKEKFETDELTTNSADIPQRNTFDQYFDFPKKNFKLGQYQTIGQIGIPELLSFNYIDLNPGESTGNGCQTIVLNAKWMEINHDVSSFLINKINRNR